MTAEKKVSEHRAPLSSAIPVRDVNASHELLKKTEFLWIVEGRSPFLFYCSIVRTWFLKA